MNLLRKCRRQGWLPIEAEGPELAGMRLRAILRHRRMDALARAERARDKRLGQEERPWQRRMTQALEAVIEEKEQRPVEEERSDFAHAAVEVHKLVDEEAGNT